MKLIFQELSEEQRKEDVWENFDIISQLPPPKLPQWPRWGLECLSSHLTFLNYRLRIKIAPVTQSKITSKCTQELISCGNSKAEGYSVLIVNRHLLSFQTTLHSRSDGDGKCTVNSQHSQTSPTDLSTVEADGEEENEEVIEEIGGATGIQRSTIETQTSQSSSSFVREAPCTHYVVDLNSPRRDYVINYNSNSRHDPPPPYSEM